MDDVTSSDYIAKDLEGNGSDLFQNTQHPPKGTEGNDELFQL
jgi:hypothetical protein